MDDQHTTSEAAGLSGAETPARFDAEAVLHRTVSRLLVLTDPSDDTILQQVFDAVADVYGYEIFFQFHVNGPTQLELTASRGLNEAQRARYRRLEFGEYLCGQVAATRARLIAEDLPHSPYAEAAALCSAGVRCYAGFPLVANDVLLGTVAFATGRRDRLHEGELATIQSVCELAAVQMARARDTRRLQARDAQLTAALDAAHAIAYIWDIQDDRVARLGNGDAALPATGDHFDTFDDVVGMVHPDDRGTFRSNVRAALVADDGQYRSEYRVRRPDGETRWLTERGHVTRDAEGRPARLVGVSYDVTTLKETEARLLLRERQLELLADVSRRLVLGDPHDPVLLEDVFRTIGDHLGMETFYHFRPGPDPAVLHLAASGGVSAEERRQFETMRVGEWLCGRVALSRRPLIIDDVQSSTQPGVDRLAAGGATSYVGYPLLAGTALLGTIAYVSRRGPRRRDVELEVLPTLCDQIATILERARLLREVRASEEHLRLATLAARMGSFDADVKAGRVRLSPQLATMAGTPGQLDLGAEAVFAAIHPDDRAPATAVLKDVLSPGGAGWGQVDVRHVQADGSQAWLRYTAQALFHTGPEGTQATRLIGAVLDVTDQRQRDEALRDAAARQATLMHLGDRLRQITAPAALQDEATMTLQAHLGVERVLYASCDAAHAVVIRDTVSNVPSWAGPSRPDGLEQALIRLFDRAVPVAVDDVPSAADTDLQAWQAWGVAALVSVPIMREGRCVAGVAVQATSPRRWTADDIDLVCQAAERTWAAVERAEALKALRGSEELYRAMFEVGALGKAQADPFTGRLLRVNAALRDMTGRPDADLLSHSYVELAHPADRNRVEAVFAGVIAGLAARADVEHRIARPDGTAVWVHADVSLIRAVDGAAATLALVVHDISDRKAAEETQQQFVSLVEAASDFVAMSALDGTVLYVNPAGRRLVGLPDQDAARRTNAIDYYPDEDRPFVRDTVAPQVRAHGAWEGETRFQHFTTRERIDVLQKAFVIADPASGAPRYLATTVVDSRERKRAASALQASEERFRRMADQTPVAMWVTDAGGAVEFVNQTYCAYFGVSLEQLLGLGNWQPLLHPDEKAYVAAFVDALAERRAFRARARVRRADGEWRWVESSGQPRFGADGQFLGMIGVSPDITEQVRASEMERDAARQKDEFIAVLAHELRNPLAPIRTSVGLLRQSLSEATLVACREVIDRQVAHMSRLLDDLLDVSRLSRGQLVLQRSTVRLRDVVADAIEAIRPAAETRGHSLTLPDVPETLAVDADPARLTQVLTNLLNNAVKYTNPGGRIVLHVEAAAPTLLLRVSDNGIGLPPAMRDRIFDLFAQVEDARDRADGGLGIGLGLSRRLVEMHGGTIEAQSPGPGLGSVFTVSLPWSDTFVAPVVPPPATRLPDQSGRRVLVVDDNIDAADMLALLLDALGCTVQVAYGGHAALAMAGAFAPDLVLLDLGMPGLDGATVCRQLRELPWDAAPVIAALTGWGQPEDRQRTRIAGFDHHLVKPVSPDDLVALLETLPHRNAS